MRRFTVVKQLRPGSGDPFSATPGPSCGRLHAARQAPAPTSQAGLQGFAASCLWAPKSSFCLTLRFSRALDTGVAGTQEQ